MITKIFNNKTKGLKAPLITESSRARFVRAPVKLTSARFANSLEHSSSSTSSDIKLNTIKLT